MTIGDSSVPAHVDVSVSFGDAGTIAGATGCNRFVGSYREFGDVLEMSPLATTRKSCVEELMSLEERLLTAMRRTRRYERDQMLDLFDEHGTQLARFRAGDGPP